MSEKKGSPVAKALIIAFLVIWALIVLFPFYWMVLTSFKDTTLFMDEKVPTFFTTEPTLSNYAKAFTEVPLGRFLLNTLIFTAATTDGAGDHHQLRHDRPLEYAEHLPRTDPSFSDKRVLHLPAEGKLRGHSG